MPAPCDEGKVVKFLSADTVSGKGKMRRIPILSAGIARRSIMIQTWSDALWRALPKCQSWAGPPWGPLCGLGFSPSPPPGRRVVLLRLDIGHTDIFMHFSSSSKQGDTGHWVTWLMAGGYHIHAIRGQRHVGVVSNLMVRSIIWVRM